jgi:Calx-beta domain/GDSL-like Lipase/Acylhydrolase family
MVSAGASNTDPNGDFYVSFTPNGSCSGGQGCSGTVRYQSQGPATVRGVVVSATYQYGTCALNSMDYGGHPCLGTDSYVIPVGGSPQLSVSDASAAEPKGADGTLTFPITLSPAQTTPVTVSYATADGSAKAGPDYAAASGTLTFPAGTTTESVPVTVHDSGLTQSASFTLNLSNASGATLTQSTATGTITPRRSLTVSVRWLQNGNPVQFTSPGRPPASDTIQLARTGGHTVPQDVTAEVTVKNDSSVTQQHISVNGVPPLSYHDPAAAHAGLPVSVTGGPVPSGNLPDLAPGASSKITYTVHATDEGVFDFSPQILSSDAATSATWVSQGAGTLTVLAPALSIDWNMPRRALLSTSDLNGPGTVLGLPKASFVTPSSWKVDLSLLDGGAPLASCPPGVSYSWTVTPPPGAQVTAQPADGCASSMSVDRLGTYTVQATRLTGTGAGLTPTAAPPLEQKVVVKDLLVVGLGDSNASGEGVGPFYFPGCNRGTASYQYQAAYALEQRVKPHTSVTFVSGACSGARTQHLIDHTYDGIDGQTLLPPQIGSVERLLVDHGSAPQRQVDAAMISIGINNIGFGPLLSYCVKHPPLFGGDPCHQQTVKRTVDSSGDVTWTSASSGQTLDKGVRGLVGHLPQRYDDLAQALPGLVPASKVYLSQYPTETSDDQGNLCSGSGSPLAQSVWGWLHSTGDLLNRAVAAGAGAHGWHTIVVPDAAFNGHGYCAHDSWFVPLFQAKVHNGNEAGAFHANLRGAKVTADVALADLCPALAPDPTACEATSATPPNGPPGTDAASSTGSTAASDGTQATLPVDTSCSAAQTSSCSVSTTATSTTTTGNATDVSAFTAAVRRARRSAEVLGRGRMTLRPGQSAQPTIKLTSAGAKALRRRKSMRVKVTVLLTGSHRAAIRRTFTITLRLKKPVPKRAPRHARKPARHH